MKYPTITEIENLRTIIKNKRARIEGLTKLLRSGVRKSDLDWIQAEIKEHEAFCAQMEKKVKAFYAPAAA